MNRWHYHTARDLGLGTIQRQRSPWRETDFMASGLRLAWLAGVRTILKAWNRLEVQGLENLPTQPPFVIVANHASHLDAVILASTLSLRWRDRVSPLAAGDYFFNSPALAGFSAKILNALPVWRDRRCGQCHELGQLRERLIQQSAIYIVFPEGSRSRDGEMGLFKPGFGTLVAGTPIPVVPCHLNGSFSALPPDSHCLRPSKIVLRIGSPMTFENVPHQANGWRQIAAEVEGRIIALSSWKRPKEVLNFHRLLDRIRLVGRFVRFSLHKRYRLDCHAPARIEWQCNDSQFQEKQLEYESIEQTIQRWRRKRYDDRVK